MGEVPPHSPGGKRTMSDRDLNHLYPAFREKVQTILEELKAYAAKNMPGYSWKIVEGYRTAAYQHSLYEKGRTKPGKIVTYKDGYKSESNHQSSLAVDIAPVHGFHVEWNCGNDHWEYLGHLARKHGLVWGGDWQKLRDMPHIEWDTDDKTTYLAARAWQRQNGLRDD